VSSEPRDDIFCVQGKGGGVWAAAAQDKCPAKFKQVWVKSDHNQVNLIIPRDESGMDIICIPPDQNDQALKW
jgi:hypothetical protein